MIGGEDAVVQHLDPIFRSLAPGVETAPRTPGATGEPTQAEYGYLHCGPNGAGHFVKMVHNGIEYGMMAAYAEGLQHHQECQCRPAESSEVDAETTPLRDPEHYQVRHRRRAGRRGVAARQRGRVLAARPDRQRVATGPGSGEFPRSRLGFRRRPLDAAGRDRRRRAGAGDQRRALFAASTRAARRSTPTSCCRRCASSSAAMSRSRRKEGSRWPPAIRRDRLFRRHRRSRLQADLSRRCLAWCATRGLNVPIIGVAKAGWTLDQLKARAADSLQHHGGGGREGAATADATCCATSMATTTMPPPSPSCASSSARRSGRCTIWRCRRACSRRWRRRWRSPAAPRTRAW